LHVQTTYSVYLLTSTSSISSFFLYSPRHLLSLHSFPTRRSSDLVDRSEPEPGRPLFSITDQAEQVYFGEDAKEPLDVLSHLHRKDRKSTRLNSSHLGISYAVFCLKKKKKK